MDRYKIQGGAFEVQERIANIVGCASMGLLISCASDPSVLNFTQKVCFTFSLLHTSSQYFVFSSLRELRVLNGVFELNSQRVVQSRRHQTKRERETTLHPHLVQARSEQVPQLQCIARAVKLL